ncbi:hypothetical protein MASR2M15_25770 [Anaerolineales bacterium]
MKRKGRLWQVDQAGNLINEGDYRLIDPIFKPLIKDVIRAYTRNIEADLHSIYLTGSIARGLGIVGQSDLDVIGIIDHTRDPDMVMQDWLEIEEDALTAQYANLVSQVQFDLFPPGAVYGTGEEFSIGAFIIRTHSACIWGPDLANTLPDFNINDQQTRLGIANDDIVQIKEEIEEALADLHDDTSPANAAYWSRRISKNILRTGFAFVMTNRAIHSRDPDIAYQYFASAYPDQAPDMAKALSFVEDPTTNTQELILFLQSHGQWIIDQADQWHDKYNPDRELALPLNK